MTGAGLHLQEGVRVGILVDNDIDISRAGVEVVVSDNNTVDVVTVLPEHTTV